MNNARFTIAGNQLKTAAAFNYESKSSYSIRLRSTDSGGLWCENAIAVTVSNANDPPSGTSATKSLWEDTSYAFAAADFGFSDPLDTPANNLAAAWCLEYDD